jgi:ribonuclease E
VVEEAAPAEPANDEAAQADGGDDGAPRRGWWQRTFGN